MSRLFISYSSRDRDLVTALASDLQSLGHELWFDAELTRTGGQKWWSNILVNLRGCDLFVFALTPNSLTSEPCQHEYEYAYALNKRILPVMLQSIDVSVLPVALQEIQFVDYRERSGKQAIALAGTLNNLPLAQPMSDPLPPEPQTPLSPLAWLSQRLDAFPLSSSEQVEIVFELEMLLNKVSTHPGAETLLHKLYEHPDLTNRVADKIRMLLPDINSIQPSTPAPATELSKQAPRLQKKVTEPTATPSIRPNGIVQRRRAFLYSLIAIFASIALLLMSFPYRFTPYLDWVLAMAIGLAILQLVGIYGIWRWRKWGVYLSTADLISTFIIFSYLSLFLYGEGGAAILVIAPAIIILIIAMRLLWLVVRNQWQFFQVRSST